MKDDKHIKSVVGRVLKEAGISKAANVFDPGDIVVLVDQVQGLNKGSKYKVKEVNPGKITIAQLNITDGQDASQEGDVIGEFDSSRFVRHNDEY